MERDLFVKFSSLRISFEIGSDFGQFHQEAESQYVSHLPKIHSIPLHSIPTHIQETHTLMFVIISRI